MQLDPELIEELSLLKRISRNATEAINISLASDPTVVAAAQRLTEKGIITGLEDGQLTDSGRDVVEHMNRLFNLLSPPLEPI